jgi:hypothetical protein
VTAVRLGHVEARSAQTECEEASATVVIVDDKHRDPIRNWRRHEALAARVAVRDWWPVSATVAFGEDSRTA